MKNNLTDLVLKIRELIEKGGYHVKRGFKLADVPAVVISNHLLEEAVELQAEVIVGDSSLATRQEAADVLLVFLHLLEKTGLPLYLVAETALATLNKEFTLDLANLKTSTPGFSRSARQDDT